MKIPEKIGQIIGAGQDFLILAHNHPDGDAVGSVSALGRGLKSLGKHVDYYMDPEIEDKLGFIDEIELFKHDASQLAPKYDAVIYVDVTAADMLAVLDRELEARGIDLQFAGLPGHVKDQIIRYGLSPRFDADHFHPTVGNAVNIYRGRHTVDWKDWDER